MKRGGPLKRKTELKRGGFLKRGKRLKPMSDKRREETPERQRVRAAVMARDGGKCQVKFAFPDQPCGGDINCHHLLKASAGGRYEETNLVACCDVHNSLIEDFPEYAEEAGLVRRPQAPVLTLAPIPPPRTCRACGDEVFELIPCLWVHVGDWPHAHKPVLTDG